MNTEAFKKAYGESRNGCNFFVRHWAVSKFQFSDGVQEVADTGCYWLIDIAATELPKCMKQAGAYSAFLEVRVENSAAFMALTVDDSLPAIWSRAMSWTDLPDGNWLFELADEGERVAMILISEH